MSSHVIIKKNNIEMVHKTEKILLCLRGMQVQILHAVDVFIYTFLVIY